VKQHLLSTYELSVAEVEVAGGAAYDHFGSKGGSVPRAGRRALRHQDRAGRAGCSRAPSKAMPFDREFALLFSRFVCAAGLAM